MSVLIRGMELPHDCEECKLCVIIPVGDYETLRKCVVLNKRAEYVIRRKDCPLIEVPPHGRLIDADALNNMINQSYPMTDRVDVHNGYAIVQEMMKQMPTIIEAEEADQ